MMQSRLKGSRASSKNLAFGLIEMSADFINAYMLGNVGRTGHSVGACATFLYNLQLAKDLIEKGECKVAVVGSAEAPITPEIFDGFYAVSALSDNKKMIELQNQLGEESKEPNYRKACRPFGDNIGMVLGESAQFIILMNEELAIKLGAEIYPGFAASEVLINDNNEVIGVATNDMGIKKDGSKKSSFEPGIELHAKYTIFAEGSRGHLGKELIKKFNLDEGKNPQQYGIGLKEIWEVSDEQHQEGLVMNTAGWPLDNKTYGGSFIYHAEKKQIYI